MHVQEVANDRTDGWTTITKKSKHVIRNKTNKIVHKDKVRQTHTDQVCYCPVLVIKKYDYLHRDIHVQ